MKLSIKLFVLLLALICVSATGAAQYLLNQTYYNPVKFDSYTERVTVPVNSDMKFVGTKRVTTANGKVSSVTYYGSAIFSDGGRICTEKTGYGFDGHLHMSNGVFYEIEPTGEVTAIECRNDVTVSKNRIYKDYHIEDECIVFHETPSGYSAGSPYVGSTSGGYNSGSSSGSSSYNRHEATCGGCHGDGLCQRCHGRGYNASGHQCSLCHGTGRCVSCGGVGKIYGNF